MQHRTGKIILLCCILALCLTGCAACKSTVQYEQLLKGDQRVSLLNDGLMGALEFDFQDDIQGIVFYREIWQTGQCIEAVPQLYAGPAEKIASLYISIGMEDTACRWDLVENGSDGDTSSIMQPLIQTELPDGGSGSYGYKAVFIGDNAKNHTARLNAGESYTLAAQIFDLNVNITKENGDYFVQNDFGNLEADNLDFQNYDYAIVLRMDTFATAEEVEQEAETREQENRAKIGARL